MVQSPKRRLTEITTMDSVNNLFYLEYMFHAAMGTKVNKSKIPPLGSPHNILICVY
jgi:hypothetical protein